MATFLFENIIFGPIKSRRLGTSLGVNLLPLKHKFCSYNCIYCECGWTDNQIVDSNKLVPAEEVRRMLELKLQQIKEEGGELDTITFAGNGEPTLHPEFAQIVDNTIFTRNKYFPSAKISVLTNASMLDKLYVNSSLLKIDNALLKLDAGNERMFELMNGPKGNLDFNVITNEIINFKGKKIIQTMFLRGEINGEVVDNTIESEVDSWIELLKKIKPDEVMIYPVDRDTPAKGLIKVSKEELEQIAGKIAFLDATVKVAG
ncbi:MAG: radical SAM protein [Bacteroidota bacterium]